MVDRYPHINYAGKLDKMHNIMTTEFEVEYEEVFHLKDLYKHLKDWVDEWNYKPMGGFGEVETLYMELVDGKGQSNHYIWWRFEREINSYVKYFIKFNITTLLTTKIEVMHNGQKVKMNKGNPIFRAEAWVMLDWKQEWRKHWLLKHLDPWYVKRWYKSFVDAHKKQLWFELYNFEETIKQYLELNTTVDMPEPYHPNKGFED
jgi:hypothetical protein